ncbi:hypothetical protein ILYODFUR_011698 [Ilyodon furcidens]|uniref:Uncharacterized protein n=1 Tax=Ilyodon furcidens TaxID=33524 RepID=A0ABV0V3B5_9TELE
MRLAWASSAGCRDKRQPRGPLLSVSRLSQDGQRSKGMFNQEKGKPNPVKSERIAYFYIKKGTSCFC